MGSRDLYEPRNPEPDRVSCDATTQSGKGKNHLDRRSLGSPEPVKRVYCSEVVVMWAAIAHKKIPYL